MWIVIAIFSALLFGLAGFLMKYGSVKKGSLIHLLCGLYVSGTLGFFVLSLFQGGVQINWQLLIAGVVVGIGSTLGNYYFMKALDYGPASLTSPLSNLNLVFVVLMAMFVYGETLTLVEIVAVSVVLVCVSLLPIDPQESLSIKHKIWYVFIGVSIILFFLRNGGLKITEEFMLNNTLVLFYAYFIGVVWTLIQMRFTKKSDMPSAKSKRTGWVIGGIAGLFSFSGMQLYAYALALGPASIVSPIFSTNALVVAVLSIALFKERLSIIQIVALTGTLVGIILLRLA